MQLWKNIVTKKGIGVLLLTGGLVTSAAGLKDTESASHGDTAATYQEVNRYEYPGFKVIQFNLAVLSHYSYLLISNGQALVVDPGRDVFAYLETAKKEKATIKGVFLTHSHADFVAGHLELASRASCPVYFNDQTKPLYPHQAMKAGATLEIGDALLKILETPGHTPDGLCALVYGKPRKDTPELVFTGDTLFVGSVGRPDLMGGAMAAATLASQMYDSWTTQLAGIGDKTVVFPAHGAGSLCGAHLSDRPFSTIGEEKTSNVYLQYKFRSDFIAAVLDGLPEAPQYFKHNAKMNHDGPALVNWEAPLPPEAKADATLTDAGKVYVVDLRDATDYAAGHIPNSVNIALRGRLETWTGIMVPWGSDLVLCGTLPEITEAVTRLHRVGYDTCRWIQFETWRKAGQTVKRNETVIPRDLYGLMQAGKAPVIVDVRLPSEWMGLRIGQVVNLPLNHLAELSTKLDATQPVVTVCNSAYRSSLAAGILERQGFQQVSSLAGGSEAWLEAGLPVFGADAGKMATAAPAVPRRVVPLPERLSAAELKRLLMDLPDSFDLVDIRPAGQFADYHLPGARNVEIADLINNPAFLTGAGPLIVVDRDGSLAMMVAGILSQKTQRQIKALFGGLEAYWNEAGEGMTPAAPAGNAAPATPSSPSVPAVTPAAPAAPPAAPPPAAKKRSAGC